MNLGLLMAWRFGADRQLTPVGTPRHRLHRATELGRTIVTRDVSDFVLLHEAWLAWSDAWEARRKIEHPGILVIHPVKSPSVEDWAQDIVGLLRAVPSLSNRLFSWDGQNGWQEYVDRKFHPFRMPTERGNGPA